MKKIMIAAILSFLSISVVLAQEIDKKALRKQEKIEKKMKAQMRRDSIAAIDAAIKAADAAIAAEQESRRGATEILVHTKFDTEKEVFDLVIQNLLNGNHTLSQIDKDFYFLRTAEKAIGKGSYDMFFRVYKVGDNVRLSITARGHVTVTYAVRGIGGVISGPQTIKNEGPEGSINKTVFAEMIKYANKTPHTKIEFLKKE